MGRAELPAHLHAVDARQIEVGEHEIDCLRRRQLERAIIDSAVVTPAAYRRYLNLAGEQRIVATATLAEAGVTSVADLVGTLKTDA